MQSLRNSNFESKSTQSIVSQYMEVGDYGLTGATVVQPVAQAFNTELEIVTIHTPLMMETTVLGMAISILYVTMLPV